MGARVLYEGIPSPCAATLIHPTQSRLGRRGMRIKVVSTAVSNSGEGKAWLVGCGPGDVELLTLKAVKLIKAAEVILYDDLGTEAAVKEFAPEGIVREYVGKRGRQKSVKQEKINDLLIGYCLQGKQVVRLKGGCPSVFSRCSSEIAALDQAGIPWELVPGISSAMAAPLVAGNGSCLYRLPLDRRKAKPQLCGDERARWPVCPLGVHYESRHAGPAYVRALLTRRSSYANSWWVEP